MFFTPELLSRRDSGFGLLWLAATLGSKSSFKKLSRRSVITADISQLCELIAEPPEPLALRLSSNLMIGVARVYKVKQEIFFADVNTCFTTLKKAVQELHASSDAAAQLQMGQPSVRPDTVTISVDPGAAFAMDFDNLFAAWEERPEMEDEDQSDGEFDPRNRPSKKRRTKEPSVSAVDNARGDLHTLKENHDFVLSASFDVSFQDDVGGGIAPSSSQIGGFRFDDNFLGGVDIGGDIGDELAKELGPGWGAPADNVDAGADHLFDGDMNVQDDITPNFEFNADVGFGGADAGAVPPNDSPSVNGYMRQGSKRPLVEADDVSFTRDGSIVVPLLPLNAELGMEEQEGDAPAKKKTKRVRLLLDARTELTNEELQRARSHYLEEQAALRREIAQKKAEKESEKILEDMILGVPSGLHAQVLVDFWLENFRLQVEARSGQLHLDSEGEPPRKRRKVNEHDGVAEEFRDGALAAPDLMEVDMAFGMDNGPGYVIDDIQDRDFVMDSRLRSSEEPGQARRASRPPSLLGDSHFDFDLQPTQISASQRSALFPWDHAGVSSSVAGAFDLPVGSDRFSLPLPARGSSLSSRGRDSPLRPLSGLHGDFGVRDNQLDGDEFEFAVPGDRSMQNESQKSDMNVIALERNSLNFLEYAKMQFNAMPSASSLSFDDVVPKATSTPHVASAAFYHCLVLATKNLIGVEQLGTFGTVKITVK